MGDDSDAVARRPGTVRRGAVQRRGLASGGPSSDVFGHEALLAIGEIAHRAQTAERDAVGPHRDAIHAARALAALVIPAGARVDVVLHTVSPPRILRNVVGAMIARDLVVAVACTTNVSVAHIGGYITLTRAEDEFASLIASVPKTRFIEASDAIPAQHIIDTASRWLREEMTELGTAHARGDIAQAFDALLDAMGVIVSALVAVEPATSRDALDEYVDAQRRRSRSIDVPHQAVVALIDELRHMPAMRAAAAGVLSHYWNRARGGDR